ncbi:MAG: hypothetical protein WHU94_16825 [Thermogemmata sp.]
MNDEASTFIEAWVVDPTTCDFRKCDVLKVLEKLEPRLYDTWEHGRDAERQALLKLKEALLAHQEALLQEMEATLAGQPVMETDAGIKCFPTLSQAVAFIAEAIERNAPSELMAQCAHIQRPRPTEPYYTESFTNHIFPQLQRYHQELDFRTRYKGKRFPSNETRFTLGGHMKELWCIHIEFVKIEQGWVLDSIWECR